jgi:hypothetical protein
MNISAFGALDAVNRLPRQSLMSPKQSVVIKGPIRPRVNVQNLAQLQNGAVW